MNWESYGQGFRLGGWLWLAFKRVGRYRTGRARIYVSQPTIYNADGTSNGHYWYNGVFY